MIVIIINVKSLWMFSFYWKCISVLWDFLTEMQKPFLIRAKVPASGAQRHRADTGDYITAQLQLFFFLSWVATTAYIYNIYSRNTTTSYFSLLWSVERGAWSVDAVEHGTWGRRPYSLNKLKLSNGPYKIWSRAGFGPRAGLWACLL